MDSFERPKPRTATPTKRPSVPALNLVPKKHVKVAALPTKQPVEEQVLVPAAPPLVSLNRPAPAQVAGHHSLRVDDTISQLTLDKFMQVTDKFMHGMLEVIVQR